MAGGDFSLWVSYPDGSTNLYTMDQVEPYVLATYEDAASGLHKARELIDEFLLDRLLYEPWTVERLLSYYQASGPIPRLQGPLDCHFDANTYAATRVEELVGSRWNPADAIHGYSDEVETDLSTGDLLTRLRGLGIARTFAALTAAGEFECILRLDDGVSLRFWRAQPEGAITLTVAQYAKRPDRYQAVRQRWNWTASLLEARSPLELAHQTIADSMAEGAEVLDLSGHGLTSIPDAVWQALPRFQGLYLDGNWLRDVPPQLGSFHNLRRLGLGSNQLATFPDSVLELKELNYLKLSANRLAAIPPQIGRLSNLQVLLLDQNLLSVLPAELGQLMELRRLALNHNRLEVIPSVLGTLPRLAGSAGDCGLSAAGNWLRGKLTKLDGKDLFDFLATRYRQCNRVFTLTCGITQVNRFFLDPLTARMPSFPWIGAGGETGTLDITGEAFGARIRLRSKPASLAVVFPRIELSITLLDESRPDARAEMAELRDRVVRVLGADLSPE